MASIKITGGFNESQEDKLAELLDTGLEPLTPESGIYTAEEIAAAASEVIDVQQQVQEKSVERNQQASLVVEDALMATEQASQDLDTGLVAQEEIIRSQTAAEARAIDRTQGTIDNYNQQVNSEEAQKRMQAQQQLVNDLREKYRQKQLDMQDSGFLGMFVKSPSFNATRYQLDEAEETLRNMRADRAAITQNTVNVLAANLGNERAMSMRQMEEQANIQRVTAAAYDSAVKQVALNEKQLQLMSAQTGMDKDMLNTYMTKLDAMSKQQALTIQSAQAEMTAMQKAEVESTIEKSKMSDAAIQEVYDDALRALGRDELVGTDYRELRKDTAINNSLIPVIFSQMNQPQSASAVLSKVQSGEALTDKDYMNRDIITNLIKEKNAATMASYQEKLQEADYQSREAIQTEMQNALIPTHLVPGSPEWQRHGADVEKMYKDLRMSAAGPDGEIVKALQAGAIAIPDQKAMLQDESIWQQARRILGISAEDEAFMRSDEFLNRSAAISPNDPQGSVLGIVDNIVGSFSESILNDANKLREQVDRNARAYASYYSLVHNSSTKTGMFPAMENFAIGGIRMSDSDLIGRRLDLKNARQWTNLLYERSIQRRARSAQLSRSIENIRL